MHLFFYLSEGSKVCFHSKQSEINYYYCHTAAWTTLRKCQALFQSIIPDESDHCHFQEAFPLKLTVPQKGTLLKCADDKLHIFLKTENFSLSRAIKNLYTVSFQLTENVPHDDKYTPSRSSMSEWELLNITDWYFMKHFLSAFLTSREIESGVTNVRLGKAVGLPESHLYDSSHFSHSRVIYRLAHQPWNEIPFLSNM